MRGVLWFWMRKMAEATWMLTESAKPVASLMCPLSRRVRITCSSRVKRRFMKVSLGLLGLVLPPPSAGVEARAGLADARHVAVSEDFRFQVLGIGRAHV